MKNRTEPGTKSGHLVRQKAAAVGTEMRTVDISKESREVVVRNRLPRVGLLAM